MAQDSRYETILPYSKEIKNSDSVAERLTNIGRADDIRNMLSSGKTPEQIADFFGYDLLEVKKVQELMSAENIPE